MASRREYDDPAPPKKSNTLWYVLGGISAALVLFCCLPCCGFGGWTYYSNYKTEQRVNNEAGVPVTTQELANGATTTHMDKVIIVSGKVTSKQLTGVTLDGNIDCIPISAEAQAFQNLQIGQQVRIKGLCQGKINNVQVVGGQIAK